MKAIALTLLLSACAVTHGQPIAQSPPPLVAHLRTCPAPPPVPEGIKSAETVNAYARALELNRRECAERHRLAVAAYDELRAAMLRKP